MKLKGKTVAISGATRGIGRAIAIACAEQGANVGLNFRGDPEAASALQSELRTRFGVDAYLMPFDVKESESVNTAVAELLRQIPRLDGWVNNAAIHKPGLLVSLSDQIILDQVQTNLVGAIYCARAIIPHFMEHRAGVIINIGSVATSVSDRGQAVYAATKGGIEALTRSLAKEYGKLGIRVNCVTPGPIATEMLKHSLRIAEESIKARLPMGQIGKPEDVAALVTFLLSDDAVFITGSNLSVDGGYAL